MDSEDKLAADNSLALSCFFTAVTQKNNSGAARFREELHTILDLQLDDIIKKVKEQ